MDDTDRKLLMLLAANPRTHFSVLARKLGLSKQAVHRRMDALKETGLIEGITASVSIEYLRAVPIMIFGRSETTSVSETLNLLGESECSNLALVAGGNYLYIVGLLRDLSELNDYADFVKSAGRMPDPTVGIYSADYPAYSLATVKKERSSRELSPLDLRIIASLKDNARKHIGDIADTVGVSTKTVSRHLDRMIAEGSVEFYVPWDPVAGGNTFMVMHVRLKEGVDKREAGRRLLSKYPLQVAFVRIFSNIPSWIFCILSMDSTIELRRIVSEVSLDEQVISVAPNFIYLERNYSTWRDRLLEG